MQLPRTHLGDAGCPQSLTRPPDRQIRHHHRRCRGIGRALAVRLAAAGANITVNDLDDAGAHTVAREVSGIAVTANCASKDGTAALIAGATLEYGQVDVFIANAGVSGVGDIDASDEDWQLALDVNVMAHVRAARLLAPL